MHHHRRVACSVDVAASTPCWSILCSMIGQLSNQCWMEWHQIQQCPEPRLARSAWSAFPVPWKRGQKGQAVYRNMVWPMGGLYHIQRRQNQTPCSTGAATPWATNDRLRSPKANQSLSSGIIWLECRKLWCLSCFIAAHRNAHRWRHVVIHKTGRTYRNAINQLTHFRLCTNTTRLKLWRQYQHAWTFNCENT